MLPALGDIQIGQLAPGTVRGWYARLAREHPSTAAKAYRLLRTMMNTAVSDELLARNPCRLDGAGKESAPERPIATLAELEQLVTAIPARFKAIVLLACSCQLRKGELCGLRRRDIDPMRSTVTVALTLQQLRNGTLIIKEPKTEAGRRTVAIPPHVLPAVTAYLVYLPALEPGFWVADLRIELPVEKGWLAGQTPTKGFDNEDSQRGLGARLALSGAGQPLLRSSVSSFIDLWSMR